ncbi:MAG TPA: DUF4214 domain-containing protein [Pirellulales bacterium]|nr:DUF4214 domain-containing protein [Pirellulales bacterium]
MLRSSWLKKLSAVGFPRASRRRRHPFRPAMLRLEPRDLLTVVAIKPAGAVDFTEGANTPMNLGQFFSPDASNGLQVSINWGDGTSTNDTLPSSTSPDFTVSGSHPYADETVPGKPFNVSVVVFDPNDRTSASVKDTAIVIEADQLSPLAFANFAANEGQTATATATFNNTNFAGSVGDLTATINWGDGKTDQGVSVTGGVVGTTGVGAITVSGSHVYADEGIYTPIVTLSDDAPGTASASAKATATIAEADTLSPLAFANFAANEGQTATATATFNTNVAGHMGDLTATINWGDGKTDQGVAVSGGVVGTTGVVTAITVSGSHVYADEGIYTPIVTLSDDAPGTASASAKATATIAEADQLSPASFADFAALEGQTATATATFNDANLAGLAGGFTATIDWGDGKTDQGVAVTGGAGRFTVSGSHVYADEGIYTPIVTLSDNAPGTAIASAKATATIAEADQLSPLAFANFAANEGQTATATATFNNAFIGGQARDLTATIDWGDGKTDQGVAVSGGVVEGTTGAGRFTVSGSHVYADEGIYTPIMTLSDDAPGTASATAKAMATIAEADQLSPLAFANFAANEGQTATATATFNNTNFAGSVGDLTATIHWGDGKTDQGVAVSGGVVEGTTGVVTAITVSGSHVYADEGIYTPIVTLSDDAPGTASASAKATATITEADQLSLASFADFAALEGQTATATATFNDTNLAGLAGGFTATIHWGDGKTDQCLAVTGGAGRFTVSDTHVYADEGAFAPIVTLSDNAPGAAVATGTALAIIREGDLLLASATPVAGMENVALSNAQVASFTSNDADAVVTDFTATINWGDGIMSSGTVSPGAPGVFLITGAHTYLDEGSYPVTVVVRDTDSTAAATTIDATAAVAKGPTGGIQGTTAQDFVGHTYRDILLRPADQSSFKSLSQVLVQGTPFSTVAGLLDHSAEYYGQVVDRAYESYLGRGVDPNGLTNWVDAFEHGLTDEQLAARLIASDEYFHNAGGSDHAWIDATYVSLFERPADPGGESYWLAALAHGESRFQVALTIATSPEHEAFVVQADYMRFLGRTGADSEIAYWVGQMNQGLSDEDLITSLVVSDEYLRRISS